MLEVLPVNGGGGGIGGATGIGGGGGGTGTYDDAVRIKENLQPYK